jgi:hypothetical protein
MGCAEIKPDGGMESADENGFAIASIATQNAKRHLTLIIHPISYNRTD